tara:strand:- start:89 stop:466 length:378 start_codon:yes stop_codon:yes gene_type:complete
MTEGLPQLISDLGFPIAIAIASIAGVWALIKLVLSNVTGVILSKLESVIQQNREAEEQATTQITHSLKETKMIVVDLIDVVNDLKEDIYKLDVFMRTQASQSLDLTRMGRKRRKKPRSTGNGGSL